MRNFGNQRVYRENAYFTRWRQCI